MYLAIFYSVFFLRFFSQFFAHPINLKGLVVFFIFFKDLCIFSRMILRNSRTIQGQKALFFQIPGVFQDKVKFKDFSRFVGTL